MTNQQTILAGSADERAYAGADATGLVMPRPANRMVRDLVSLARSENRIAIRYRHDADAYEASGNLRLYRECLLEARNYQRQAKRHLNFARSISS